MKINREELKERKGINIMILAYCAENGTKYDAYLSNNFTQRAYLYCRRFAGPGSHIFTHYLPPFLSRSFSTIFPNPAPAFSSTPSLFHFFRF